MVTQALNDKLAEASTRLTDLCRDAGELGDPGRAHSATTRIEIGLRRLQELELTEEFAALSVAAARVEAELGGCTEADVDGAAEATLVLDFVTRARQFLHLVRSGRRAPADFFLPAAAVEPATESQQVKSDSSSATLAPGESVDEVTTQEVGPCAKEDDIKRLRRILQNAPPIKANLRGLAELVCARLGIAESEFAESEKTPDSDFESRHSRSRTTNDPAARDQAAPPDAPAAAPEATATRDSARSPTPEPSRVPRDTRVDVARELGGFVPEALALRDTILREDWRHGSNRQQMLVERVSGFLQNMANSMTLAQGLVLSDCLDECAEALRTEIDRLRHDISVHTTIPLSRVRLPALLARLIRESMVQLLRIVLLTRGGRSAFDSTVCVEGHVMEDSVQFHLVGAFLPTGAATELRIFPIRKLLSTLGGDVSSCEKNQRVVISTPLDFLSIDVVVVRSGTNSLGIPAHRIVESLDTKSGRYKDVSEKSELRYRGEMIPIVDLSVGDEYEPSALATTKEILVLQTDAGKHAVLVDAIVAKKCMLISQRQEQITDDFIGYALDTAEQAKVPVLNCSFY